MTSASENLKKMAEHLRVWASNPPEEAIKTAPGHSSLLFAELATSTANEMEEIAVEILVVKERLDLIEDDFYSLRAEFSRFLGHSHD